VHISVWCSNFQFGPELFIWFGFSCYVSSCMQCSWSQSICGSISLLLCNCGLLRFGFVNLWVWFGDCRPGHMFNLGIFVVSCVKARMPDNKVIYMCVLYVFLLTHSFGFRTDVCLCRLCCTFSFVSQRYAFSDAIFLFVQSICYCWCLRRPCQSSSQRQLERLSTGWNGWDEGILVFVYSVYCRILLF